MTATATLLRPTHLSKKIATTNTLVPPLQDMLRTLTDHFNANNTVTSYCLAVQEITLNPVQGETQPWFPALTNALSAAKVHTNTWLVGDSPLGSVLFSTIPQAIINYGNSFNACMSIISTIASQVTPVTAAQKTEINELIQATLDSLNEQLTTIGGADGKSAIVAQLSQFLTWTQDDETAFTSGQSNAENAIIKDNEQILDVKNKITFYTQKLAADSKIAAESEMGTALGIFMVVVSLAAAFMTDGAATPLVLGAVGLCAVGGAIYGDVVFSEAMKQDLATIREQQQELTDEQNQVAALTTISTSMGALTKDANNAMNALVGITNQLQILRAKLMSVQEDINQMSLDEIIPALLQADVNTAIGAWKQLINFAQAMQNSSITQQQPIPTPSTLVAA